MIAERVVLRRVEDLEQRARGITRPATGLQLVDLVDQDDGVHRLRFGQRPKVGDTFCGGGSIPFEAARLGCDVYASDLNPIACMLTWGALNIIGASPERH